MYLTPQRVRGDRRFWWDRARPLDADVSPLRAVIFDVESLGAIDRDGDPAPRAGLVDLVMSLFVAGVWVGVVSTGRRARVQPQVRQLIGEGLTETIVSADDLEPAATTAELYRLALWELGLTADSALAMVGSPSGLRAATDAELAAVASTGYDGVLVDECRRLHRRWWVTQMREQTRKSPFPVDFGGFRVCSRV